MKRSLSAPLLPVLFGAVVLAGVAGCSNDRSDLQQWMQMVRADAKPVRQRVNEPRRFEPYYYQDAGRVDPFSEARIAPLVAEDDKRGSGLAPNLDRPREPLEAWPLDSIRMVGYLANPQGRFALLQAEHLVYQTGVGNYVGSNFGVVTHIDETGIQLRELVQDAAGDWGARETTLQIDDGSTR